MTALAGILTFVFVVLLGLVLYGPVYKEHFDTYGVRVRPRKKEEKLAAPPKESVLLNAARSVGSAVLSVAPGVADRRSKELLMYANYRSEDHLAAFIGIKSIFTGGTAIALLITATGNAMQLLLAVPASAVSWLMPNFYLARRVSARQAAILRELPIVIDLMIVCAQAGMGLLAAIDKVNKEVRESCPNLAVEFDQLLQDVKVFAKPVGVSLKDMGERCGVEELSAVAGSLISAESKGSDISYPLKMQSEALRDRLKRKKEEEASKVPVKMVPVIMIFIMPSILIPMLGPAVITILNALGPVFGGS